MRLKSPRPRADRAPFAVGRPGLPGAIEQRMHAVLKPIVEIRIEVAVVGRRQGVAARHQRLDLPARGLDAARLRRSRGCSTTPVARGGQPGRGQRDARVCGDGLVAVEVQPDDDGHAAARGGRRVQQDVDCRLRAGAGKAQRDLGADGGAAKRRAIHAKVRRHHRRAWPRRAAVDDRFELAQQLGAPASAPVAPSLTRVPSAMTSGSGSV